MRVRLKFNIVAECDLEVTEDNYPGAYELDTVDEVLQHIHAMETEDMIAEGPIAILETVDVLKGTAEVTLEVTVADESTTGG